MEQLNTVGIKAALLNLVNQGKIDEAKTLFDNHNREADKSIREYNTKDHEIMQRPDKVRKDKSDYKTNKLPRNWQQYINEVALFFFLGNPLKWELVNNAKEQKELADTFAKFKQLLEDLHYDSCNRQAKRIAGAETECAKLYAMYKDEGVEKTKIVILSRSKGYELRPMFNRFGDMKAFGLGYQLLDIERNIEEHFDIYTSECTYECVRSDEGGASWKVTTRNNPIQKIPVIYINQPKEWDGVQERIERDEWSDSKNADVVEYFADPYLKASKQILNKLADAKEVGKLIEVTSKDDVFDYVTPPEASEMKKTEKSMLKDSILQGSFTPDLSYENIKGLGAISGEAQSKANILGHIKRQNRMEIYNELFERERNLILAIMSQVLYPKEREKIAKMKIQYSYQDPFMGGMDDNSEEIVRLHEAGIMSIEAAVEANRNIKNKLLEVERIKEEQKTNTQNNTEE